MFGLGLVRLRYGLFCGGLRFTSSFDVWLLITLLLWSEFWWLVWLLCWFVVNSVVNVRNTIYFEWLTYVRFFVDWFVLSGVFGYVYVVAGFSVFLVVGLSLC